MSAGIAARLRERHAAALQGFVRHPFFLAAEDGTLPRAARDRYFVNERRFVGAARGIFAHLLAKAPTLGSARHVVAILDGLVNEQEPFFDRLYAELGLREEGPPPGAVAALSDGMTAIARDGPYVAGLAAMYMAESTYAEVSLRGDWASRADPTVADWFRLHAETPFLEGVRWAESELDAVWDDAHAEAVDRAARRAIELEIAFHSEPLAFAGGG